MELESTTSFQFLLKNRVNKCTHFSNSARKWSRLIQVIIGCFGLVANTVGIPLFFKIGGIFNLSLALLAMVDNVAIVSTIALYVVETEPTNGPWGTLMNLVQLPNSIQEFGWDRLALQVLKNAACDASVLIVAVLAYERCYAVNKPLKYRTQVSTPDRKPIKRLGVLS